MTSRGALSARSVLAAAAVALGSLRAPAGCARAFADSRALLDERESREVGRALERLLRDVHAAHAAGVRTAQLAIDGGSSRQVKDFARAVRDEHRRLDAELTELASRAFVRLDRGRSERRGEREAEQLPSLQPGVELDRAFVARIRSDHEKIVRTLREAGDRAQLEGHPELTALLRDASRIMGQQLERADELDAALAPGEIR